MELWENAILGPQRLVAESNSWMLPELDLAIVKIRSRLLSYRTMPLAIDQVGLNVPTSGPASSVHCFVGTS